jgi:hypothetical protein
MHLSFHAIDGYIPPMRRQFSFIALALAGWISVVSYCAVRANQMFPLTDADSGVRMAVLTDAQITR